MTTASYALNTQRYALNTQRYALNTQRYALNTQREDSPSLLSNLCCYYCEEEKSNSVCKVKAVRSWS